MVDTSNNEAVWMASSSVGWAVGASGSIGKTTDGGATWTPQPSGVTVDLNGIWGNSPTSVWAVGDGGTVLFWDGTSWTSQTSGTTLDLFAISGSNASNVWAVGATSTIIKWNGTAWITQSAPNGVNDDLNGVWAANNNNTVIAVGAQGRVLRTTNSGATWSNFDSNTPNTVTLHSVWGSAANSIWIVGTGGTVRFYNGTAWGAQTSGVTTTLFGISGANATNIWAVGQGGNIVRFDGITWTNQPSDTNQSLNGIHVVDTSNIVAVGTRKSSTRWNGTTWSATQSQFPAITFTDVWASDDDKAWFTNTNGLIIRWNGTTFANTTSGVNTSLTAIWGYDDANIWAVGAAGVILKWNGTAWATQTSPVTVQLNDVWGTSATNVWAVGNNGTILRWNGTAWTRMTSGTTQNLNAIWARDSANAWAVGDRGTILKGSTTSWAAQTSLTTNELSSVWGTASNVWAVGDAGTIRKLTGSTWAADASGVTTNFNKLTGTTLRATQLWAGHGPNVRSTNATLAFSGNDGSTNVALNVAGLWAAAQTSVFLTTTGGMIFTNAPTSVPQINVLRPTLPQPTPLADGHSTLDLGPTNTGTTTTVTLTIRNTGTSPLSGLAITDKLGTHSSEFTLTNLTTTSLNPTQSTTFDVTFSPTADGLRTASFRIASNDPTEPSFLISLAGTGQTLPTFTTPPSSRSINPGASTTFSVVVAGTKPITYQWRKNGVDITGATASSYTRLKVTEFDQDVYDVVATNIAGSVDSPDATLSVNDPVVITVPPVTQSANAGTSVTFSVVGTGTPPFTYQWTKNRVSIAGATSDTFVIPSAQVTNAAAYAVVVRNVVGPVTSPSANLAVADSALRILALPTGATATIAAPISGTFTSFVWTQGSSALPTGPLTADPRYTGFAGKTLKITKLIESDSSFLRLDVVAPGTPPTTLTTQTQLIVYNAPPAITLPGAPPNDVLLLPDAQVAAPYAPYNLPYDSDPLKTPTAFSVSGLPTGLKIDPKTGIVSGKPSVALTAPRTYPLTFTASNAKGKSTAKGSLTLQPLPPGTTGTFTGPIAQEPIINLDLGGRIDATLTSTGSFSGKIILGSLTYSFKDVLVSAIGNPQPTAVATILRRGLPNLTVSFTVDGPNHRLITGQISDSTQTATFVAWKNRWNTSTPPAELTTLRTEYPGYYTFALPAATPLSPIVPQGAGSGSFTLSASTGKLTVSGRLADGTAFTTATFAGPLGEILVYQNLHSKLGSILGTLDITPGSSMSIPPFGDNTLGGNLTWKKPASTSRTYGDALTTTMTTVGSRYIAPAKTEVVMGLIDNGTTNNASIKFTEGGISDTFTSPDVDVRIRVGGSVVRPVLSPAAPSLTITPTTGLFTGSFTRVDQNPAVPGTTITRTSSYRGFLVRTPSGWVGSGYFLLAKRPAAMTTEKVTTTDILSGLVELKPIP